MVTGRSRYKASKVKSINYFGKPKTVQFQAEES